MTGDLKGLCNPEKNCPGGLFGNGTGLKPGIGKPFRHPPIAIGLVGGIP